MKSNQRLPLLPSCASPMDLARSVSSLQLSYRAARSSQLKTHAAGMGMSSEQLEQSRKEVQERLAALSENCDLIVAESSEHGVPFTQPSLVADQIAQAVDAVRRHIPVKDSSGTSQQLRSAYGY